MHFTVTIYYNISNLKKSPKIQKWFDRQKKHKPGEWYHAYACMKFQNYPNKTVGEDAFYSYYILYHYFQKFQKFAKNTKMIRSSKKAQAKLVTSYLIPVLNLKAIRLKL